MLKLMSRFVLEVLPYMLSAPHGNQLAGASNSADRTIRALKLVHEDDTPFAPSSSRFSKAVHQPVAK